MLPYCALLRYVPLHYTAPLFTSLVWALSMDMSRWFTISTSLEYIVKGRQNKAISNRNKCVPASISAYSRLCLHVFLPPSLHISIPVPNTLADSKT
jgi:hypothetical protein